MSQYETKQYYSTEFEKERKKKQKSLANIQDGEFIIHKL